MRILFLTPLTPLSLRRLLIIRRLLISGSLLRALGLRSARNLLRLGNRDDRARRLTLTRIARRHRNGNHAVRVRCAGRRRRRVAVGVDARLKVRVRRRRIVDPVRIRRSQIGRAVRVCVRICRRVRGVKRSPSSVTM